MYIQISHLGFFKKLNDLLLLDLLLLARTIVSGNYTKLKLWLVCVWMSYIKTHSYQVLCLSSPTTAKYGHKYNVCMKRIPIEIVLTCTICLHNGWLQTGMLLTVFSVRVLY